MTPHPQAVAGSISYRENHTAVGGPVVPVGQHPGSCRAMYGAGRGPAKV